MRAFVVRCQTILIHISVLPILAFYYCPFNRGIPPVAHHTGNLKQHCLTQILGGWQDVQSIQIRLENFFSKKFFNPLKDCAGYRVWLVSASGERGDEHMSEHMSPSERRLKILERLCVIRHDTCDHLAEVFGVSNATIRRDITILSCSYPVETVCGRFYGGVRVKDDYYPYRKSLTPDHIELLTRLSTSLNDKDLATMSSILFPLAP